LPPINLPTDEKKFNTVITKNTLFLPNNDFLVDYENNIIEKRKKLLLELQNNIQSKGLEKKIIVDFIQNNEEGLECVLTLIGISEELFQRIFTAIRILDDPEINSLLSLDKWDESTKYNVSKNKEWSVEKISKMAKNNSDVANGIVEFLFEAPNSSIFKKNLSLFEVKKLGKTKFKFTNESLIDSLIRYRVKGSLSALKQNNAENIIEKILNQNSIKFTRGKLPKIPQNITRTMDFIIPSKESPELIIEVVKVITTSSGMGDKAKTEIQMHNTIQTHYPNSLFIGFVDGVGWLVREGDLKRMVSGQDDVFTFHEDELKRFEHFIFTYLSPECYDKNKEKTT
tara:strand:+ start:1040 stop:2062 length:1023 start_codon:yes stop_codon:yes gene_type:complete